MSNSDNTGKKQDTRFKPGQCGNRNGRPKGSLNATTLAAQALLDGEAEILTTIEIAEARVGVLRGRTILVSVTKSSWRNK
jgi:Family of unknown function (DUF5681)